MTVVFTCKSIHFKNATNHRLSEELVADESIVNIVMFLRSTPSLKLFGRVEFFATFFLPLPVTVWSALSDVKVRDGQIQHGRDVLLVFCCIIFHKVSTCAVYNACVPAR